MVIVKNSGYVLLKDTMTSPGSMLCSLEFEGAMAQSIIFSMILPGIGSTAFEGLGSISGRGVPPTVSKWNRWLDQFFVKMMPRKHTLSQTNID